MNLIKDFASAHSRTWVNIFDSIDRTNLTRQKITTEFSQFGSLTSTDADLVVFGSIARNECTSKSDVDWTLLVDGQVGVHYQTSGIIKTALEKLNLQEPGTSGMFGQNTYSHELVHYIGGEDDTNHNISRRILLLLESEKMLINGESDQYGTAYERVRNAIIFEYVNHDSALVCNPDKTAKVPRFLLNDIIRFWRTLCVDFAYKQKDQPGIKWGLRNIKLRLSRKLIYIKGLLMCFSCYINSESGKDAVTEHLKQLISLTPLEIFIHVLKDRNLDTLLLDVLDQYNEFLGLLNDEPNRQRLADLPMQTAYDDQVFLQARDIANKFQSSLYKIFEHDADLNDFTKKYVLF